MFEVRSLGQSYPEIIAHLLATGQTVSSRIGETKEILNYRLHVAEPDTCIVGRAGFSRRFMIEEIAQILAGTHDNDRLREIVPRAAELITHLTAYGPRTWRQLQLVAHELDKNPTSRRAVVYVGREDDLVDTVNPDTAGEMPCTCVWQFHLRDNRLHMSVYMRSWDAVWGLGFDVPSFVAVQLAVAQHLRVDLGTYTHTAGSFHIYDRHYDIKTWPGPHVLSKNIGHLIGDTIEETRWISTEYLAAASYA